MSASTEVTLPGADMTPEAQVQATVTVGSVVVLGLATVGAVVVTKKIYRNAHAAWKYNRGQKKH